MGYCAAMSRSVGYAWNNEFALAYEVVGEGAVDLLLLAGAPSNLDLQWESPSYAAFLRGLAEGRRLIITDRRGTGLSDRFSPSAIQPIESLTDDLLRVLDAVRSQRAVVMSWWETTMVAQLFAATHPERCAGLIMIDPAAAWLPTPDMPWLPDAGQQEAMLARDRIRWGVALSDEISGDMDEAERDWYLRLSAPAHPRVRWWRRSGAGCRPTRLVAARDPGADAGARGRGRRRIHRTREQPLRGRTDPLREAGGVPFA